MRPRFSDLIGRTTHGVIRSPFMLRKGMPGTLHYLIVNKYDTFYSSIVIAKMHIKDFIWYKSDKFTFNIRILMTIYKSEGKDEIASMITD
jgi:hypothetical protein